MKIHRLCLIAGLVAVFLLPAPVVADKTAAAKNGPSIASILKPGLPLELVSARKADRIAWISYEEGKRNVFTAVGPAFKAERVTSFLKDDGIDLTQVRVSDDGSTIVFVRGHTPNNTGWIANPNGDPNGADRTIWAARTGAPGSAHRIAEGQNPEVSPDGKFVLYMKEGQIYRARVTPTAMPSKVDRGEAPFIKAWGVNSGPRWSPDSTRVAFTSNRVTHSFIGLYEFKTNRVTYIAAGVDRDTSPTWSPDGKRIAFIRRPGATFGTQPSPGGGSGMPAEGAVGGGRGGGGRGAAAPPAAAAAPGGRQGAPATGAAQPPAQAGRQGGGGRGGRGGGAEQQAAPPDAPLGQQAGLYRGQLASGQQMAVMIAELAGARTGGEFIEAKEVWHPAAGSPFGNINNITWNGDHFTFAMLAKPTDESNSYYSFPVSGASQPVQLTTTEGIIEDATAAAFSKDGKTLFYCTNTGDIDRRHIWSVPVAGGTPQQITAGVGIENVPAPLASGKQIAVLSADAKRPMSVALWPSAATPASERAKAEKVLYPSLAGFPLGSMVVPTNVTLKAEDGVEFHNQLFTPADLKPGEKRPALIFVHGGPARQMLLGWHYLSFYHVFYGVNQWLANQGYIVMSVNYRSGVGYGRGFRQAPETGSGGNSEYRDVLAAGKWLAAQPNVDTTRFGIWGLSYGGLLTAQALARNSDLFKLGIDLAGVHVRGALDPQNLAYRSSAISEIDRWKSPVLLVHGDDDRNVNFAQTVGLVQLLRARNIYHELIVFPDDIHETLLHSRWLYTFDRMEAFLNKFFGETTASGGGR
jgi:dipeptidyl-peptidase 4